VRFSHRFIFLACAATLAVRPLAAQEAAAGPARIQVDEIAAPSAPGASDPVLASDADGGLWLAWWEPAAAGLALRCAGFDSSAGQWQPAHTITAGPAAQFDLAHPPALATGTRGPWVAAWGQSAAGTAATAVLVSRSADDGKTWSMPTQLSKESERVSCPTLAALADGRVLAIWVDGRAGFAGPARLYVRFLTGRQMSAPDWLLAEDASPGCAPELTPLLDGGALLAYRGLTADGVQDPKTERLHGRNWQGAHAINRDGWKPVPGTDDGPRIAVDGGRVAALWLSAAAGSPQVLASTSPDAGARFLLPSRIDGGRPVGRPGAALLHDGAVLAVWLESLPTGGAALRLRRLAPEFNLDSPTPLGPAADGATGFPQIAVVHDYAGEVLTAEALIAFASGGHRPGLHTLRVTVPEGALLAAGADDCHCAPTPMQLRGYSIRGTVVAADPGAASIWDIDAVPGVMDAGRHQFQADPAVSRELHPGDTFLARIERRGAAWWLFDARRLAEP
jgi:hypothetical protein